MKNFPPGLEKGLALLKNIFEAAGKQSFKRRDGDDAVDGGIELVVAELLNMPKPQEFVEAWVSATVAADKIPTIIIDEANMAFPNGNGVNGGIEKGPWWHWSRSMGALVRVNGGHWSGSMGVLKRVNGGFGQGQWWHWSGSMGVLKRVLVRVNGGIGQGQWGY